MQKVEGSSPFIRFRFKPIPTGTQGFHAPVVPDGEVFAADLIHRTALASLQDEFAEVITTDEAIARLALTSPFDPLLWSEGV